MLLDLETPHAVVMLVRLLALQSRDDPACREAGDEAERPSVSTELTKMADGHAD